MTEEFYKWLDAHYTTWGQNGRMKGAHSEDWTLHDLHDAFLAGRALERCAYVSEPVAWMFTNEEGDDDFGNNRAALEEKHYKGGHIVPLYKR